MTLLSRLFQQPHGELLHVKTLAFHAFITVLLELRFEFQTTSIRQPTSDIQI